MLGITDTEAIKNNYTMHFFTYCAKLAALMFVLQYCVSTQFRTKTLQMK